MAQRLTFYLALLAWLWCNRAGAQQKAPLFGEIRDTVNVHQPQRSIASRLSLISGSSDAAIRSAKPVSNSELYLLNKYENGRYSYNAERRTLFTDFGSYLYLTAGKPVTWFLFPSRSILIANTNQTRRIYRLDSTLLHRSISERLYLPAFERNVHTYAIDVSHQEIAAPDLVRFGDNLAYSTQLWAGVLGFQMLDLVQFNSYEFFRINLPLIINQDNFRLNQDIGYGYADKRWKFSTRLSTAVENLQLTVSGRNEIEEANNYFFTQAISPDERTRLLFLSRYDWVSEGALTIRDKEIGLTGQLGLVRRAPYFADSLTTTGPFLRLGYELPLRGAYADFSNGYREVIRNLHYVRLSTHAFAGKGQYYLQFRPLYYFSNAATAALQVKAVAEGTLALGKLPDVLQPTVSGNGIDFNTVSEATMETLMPTALASRQSIGLHLALQKTISISTEIPYQPSIFLAANANRIWNGLNLYEKGRPKSVGSFNIAEVGVGVRNLFVFPLPVIRPAIGIGYYYGFYPSALKDLNSGSFKFTLRFFN